MTVTLSRGNIAKLVYKCLADVGQRLSNIVFLLALKPTPIVEGLSFDSNATARPSVNLTFTSLEVP